MNRFILSGAVLLLAGAFANAQCPANQRQNAANVSQVVLSSTVTCLPISPFTAPNGPTFTPTATTKSGVIDHALLNVFTYNGTPGAASAVPINSPSQYAVPSTQAALSSALSANIAVALSTIPLESPTSGVILKKDEATGALLPVSSTLGPIFTKRAETIGKGKFYFGVTHQSYHFTSYNGQSLNGISLLYTGNEPSNIVTTSLTQTAPATINLALDVRISQDVAFITYGATNHLDVSLGLPMVHAAVGSTAYNGAIYSGTGLSNTTAGRCWCVDTFTPGSFNLAMPGIGSSSLGKTGFGDMIVRVKDAVFERPNAVFAVGADLRLPTGDAQNYLGTGTTSIKPFAAFSLYTKPLPHGIVFAPHADLGWQYFGKSVLGGTLQGSPQQASLSDGSSVTYYGAPFRSTKDYLPTIFSWAIGTEVALGPRNTVTADIIGNQIGWGHGIRRLENEQITCQWPGVNGGNSFACPAPAGALAMTSAFAASTTRSSFGQYQGAFGYKARVFGDLVATFQALVRFDNNGLTARVVPLYGLGYSF